MSKQIDNKQACPFCLTSRLDIPDHPDPKSAVHCSNCSRYLGTWQEISKKFLRHVHGSNIFELEHGIITKKT